MKDLSRIVLEMFVPGFFTRSANEVDELKIERDRLNAKKIGCFLLDGSSKKKQWFNLSVDILSYGVLAYGVNHYINSNEIDWRAGLITAVRFSDILLNNNCKNILLNEIEESKEYLKQKSREIKYGWNQL